MTQDELGVMDGGKCILMLRGVRPFLSKKYDITLHKNYVRLKDWNEKNTFDIAQYVKDRRENKLRLSKNDTFINFEV